MELTRTSALAARLVELVEAGSTNDELMARARAGGRAEWPEFSMVLTDSQTAGRGRLGRSWVAPPGTMVAASLLLWPREAGITRPDALGWLPLMAGTALVASARAQGVAAELKWPNDVLVNGRKLCGILSELTDGGALVLGVGVNLTLSREQLPVPTATSFALEGVSAGVDGILADFLTRFRALYSAFVEAEGSAENSGVFDAVTSSCRTLGKVVRVELPGSTPLVGLAERLDSDGRLVLDTDGRHTAVSAGDVTHLRY